MGFIVKAVKSVFKAIGSVFKGIFSIFSPKKPKTATNTATNSRLNKSLNPDEPRKIVFGHTASALDQRFWEVFGTNSDHFDEVIACASHTIDGFEDLWAEDELMINAAGVVQGTYAGVVTRTTNDGTQGPLTAGTSGKWNANSKFTGVAHMALHWIVDDKKLPKGLPSRLTQRIRGAKVYDPRRDSTRGGSGTHRADDQSTWSYATTDANGVPIGRNNALQILWYLIGWHITSPQTGEKILVCGRGLDLNDIDFSNFIAAANACEAAQYYTDCILSTGDSHATNEAVISADGVIGRVLDVGGLWGYYPNVDDTATIAVDITDDDIADMGSVEWNEFSLPLSESYNSVVGSFVDNSDTSLYQTRPYPIVRDTGYEASDGFKRTGKKDFQAVQDVALAQRLARMMVNEAHWQGVFQATFKHRVLAAQAWSVIRYTSERFGWTKLFRVRSMGIQMGGGIELQLREVNPAIWTAGVIQPSPAPTAGTRLDPRASYAPTSVVINATTFTGANGVVLDGATVNWGTVPNGVRSIEVRYRVNGALNWNYAVQQTQDGSTSGNLGPLISGTTYEINVRFVSNFGIPGAWMAPAGGTYVAGTSGNVLDGRVGQGLGAGGQSLSVALGDSNRVRFSQLERGWVGYDVCDQIGVSATKSNGSANGIPYVQGTVNFTANGQTSSLGSGMGGIPYIPVQAGERLFVGAGLQALLLAGHSWALNIGWIGTNGLETGARTTVASGSGGIAPFPQRYGGFVTVPAGAVGAFLRFRIDNNSTGAASNIPFALGQVQVCSAGANQTTWPAFSPGPSGDAGATLGAAWGNSGNVSGTPTNLLALTGAEYINNNLVAIGSNGALTYGGGGSGGQVTYDGLGGGAYGDANRVRASLFELGTKGWGLYDASASGIAALDIGNSVGLTYIHTSGNFTANGQECSIGTSGPGDSNFWVPVTPGERIFVGAQVGSNMPSSGCTCVLQVMFYNRAGTVLGGTNVFSGNGSDSFPTRRGGFATVPAGSNVAQVRFHAANNSTGITGAFQLYLAQLMICSAGANQTAWPSFTPGPSSEYGATVGGTAGVNIKSNGGTLLYDGDLINQFGVNQLINSDFSRGLLGFATSVNGGNPGGSGSIALNTLAPTFAGMRNVLQAHMPLSPWPVTTGGSATYWDFAWSKSAGWNGIGSLSDMSTYCLRVKQNDNVWVRCLAAQHRCVFQMYVILYDKGGNWIETQGPWQGARDGGGGDGNPANFNLVGGRFTVGNANSAYAMVMLRMLATGENDPYSFVTEPAMGILAPGQTTLPQYSAGPQDSALVVRGSGARLGDSRNIPPVQAAGGRYYFNQNPTYSAAAGTPATATITVPAGTVTVGSSSISYSSASIGVSGTGGTTVTYYIYLDDPNWAGGTATMVATTDSTVPYQNDGRIFIGAVNVTYPTTGSGSGGGSGGGGGSYGCVSEDALVWTLRGQIPAREVVVGDWLVVLDYSTMEGLRFEQVTQNRIMPKRGWEIVTEGARLELSEETPLTLRDGSAIMPCELAGEELPVIIDGEFSWRPCYSQPLGREINVCLISCNCQTYAAGMERDRMILTHNVQSLPKP